MAYIEFKNVNKIYDEKTNNKVLKKISFEIEKGEFITIQGPKASGKTTILNLLNRNINVSSGSILIDGYDITDFNNKQITKYRKEIISSCLKDFYLVSNLTVKENIDLIKKENNKIIRKLGLTKVETKFPNELSSSYKKLADIARNLAKKPSIILFDDLYLHDKKDLKKVFTLLSSMIKKDNLTVIIVTEDPTISSLSNKVITLKGGFIDNIKLNKKPNLVGDLNW